MDAALQNPPMWFLVLYAILHIIERIYKYTVKWGGGIRKSKCVMKAKMDRDGDGENPESDIGSENEE